MIRLNGGIVGKDNLFLGSRYPSALGVFDSRGQEMRMRVGRYPALFTGFASWQPPNFQISTNWAAFQTALQALHAATTVTDTLSTPTGTYPGSGAYSGVVLLPDGRVFCVPFNATSARIYDPATDTLSTPTGTYPGSNAYSGGVLLPDGRVFCVPRQATSARIYDPVASSLSTPTGTYPGSDAYSTGVLLPDGRVFCVPNNATSARIYAPATDSLTTPTGTYPGSNAYLGGVLLPDGRAFCVPFGATSARIYGATVNTAPLDFNLTTSPYFNKF